MYSWLCRVHNCVARLSCPIGNARLTCAAVAVWVQRGHPAQAVGCLRSPVLGAQDCHHRQQCLHPVPALRIAQQVLALQEILSVSRIAVPFLGSESVARQCIGIHSLDTVRAEDRVRNPGID